MSKRLDVLKGLLALAETAVPAGRVIGLTSDAAMPSRPEPGGLVVVRAGDPGEPEVDLSPLSYNYQHQIPMEIVGSSEELIDAIVGAIGAAIVADRHLGGLCEWLDLAAPETDDLVAEDASGVLLARPSRTATLTITASYATPTPV